MKLCLKCHNDSLPNEETSCKDKTRHQSYLAEKVDYSGDFKSRKTEEA